MLASAASRHHGDAEQLDGQKGASHWDLPTSLKGVRAATATAAGGFNAEKLPENVQCAA